MVHELMHLREALAQLPAGMQVCKVLFLETALLGFVTFVKTTLGPIKTSSSMMTPV